MKLACPTEDHLRQFFNGSIDDSAAESISAHVADCSSCNQVLSGLESGQSDVLRFIREGVENQRLLQEPELQQLQNTVLGGTEETALDYELGEQTQAGKRLRDYRLIRKIGEGGMGTVYQAVHVHLAKSVALKILPQDKLHSKQSVQRFRQEMRAVGRVNHPNVVSASDAGTIDGQLFLVMELVEGADLARIIQSRGTLGVADACEIVRQAALGLQHAHDNGLVHRDVKPSNVMLSVDGNVKLLDLGLAGLNNTEIETDTTVVVTGRLTSVGQIMGTLDFMAPEQLLASPEVDGRADVYALGSTLFQLLTGRTPCGERSDATPIRIEAVLNEPPLDINTLRDDIPPGLRDLLLRLLAKSPDARPQTADEVAQEIQRFAPDAKLVALAEECKTSLDIPSADVDVTHDVSFLVSRMVEPDTQPPQRKLLTVRAVFAACLALIAAAIFFIVTNNGVVKLEVLDESFQVAVDGKTVTVTEEGNHQPIKLRVGEHKLTVKVGGKEFVTSDFEIRRNERVAFRIEPLEGKVIVARDGIQVASKPMPGVTPSGSFKRASQQMSEPWQQSLKDRNEENLADGAAKKLMASGERLEAKAANAPKTMSQRIKMDLNPAELRQLTDELLVIYRNDPEDLPRDSIGGDSQVFDAFNKAGRLMDLAECIEETIDTIAEYEQNTAILTIEALLQDSETKEMGYRIFEKYFNVLSPFRRDNVVTAPQEYGVDWKTVPNLIGYLRTTLLPEDVGQEGDGLSRYAGFYPLNNAKPLFCDREVLRQFIAEVRALTEKHKGWRGGLFLLAVLEAEIGNLDTAEQIITKHFVGPDGPSIPAFNAWSLADGIEGKNDALDQIATQLWEYTVRDLVKNSTMLKPAYVDTTPLRRTPLPKLVTLYGNNGRKEEARQLLYGLVDPTNQHPLVKGFRPGVQSQCGAYASRQCNACHQKETNLSDYKVLSKGLTGLGYPVDAYIALAQIDDSFQNKFSSSAGWPKIQTDDSTYDRVIDFRDKTYDYLDEPRAKASEQVTPQTVIEALRLGTFQESPRYATEDYRKLREPHGSWKRIRILISRFEVQETTSDVIDLMLSVRGVGPEAKATVFSPVIEVLKLAADFEGDGAEKDRDRLDALLRLQSETNSSDVQAAVASAAFAFLRNDIPTAKKRLEALQLMMLSDDAKAQKANASLWLVARYALQHEPMKAAGQQLAKKALAAAKFLDAPDIKVAIQRERTDIMSRHDDKLIESAKLEDQRNRNGAGRTSPSSRGNNPVPSGQTAESRVPGGTYAVSPEQLRGARCSYVPEHHEFDFVWSFNSDTFLIEGENIAPDLLQTLLGPDATAKRVEGTWSIDSGAIELVVNPSDENQTGRKAKFPIYSTGVIRIESSKRQYIFSR